MENETENKKLEILVVEDNPLHQEAAKVLLAQHNVQIVGTFDEATDFISAVYGLNYSPPMEHIDVVLTDLFLPGGKGAKIQPFGFPLALIAAKERIKHIGVLTDLNSEKNKIASTFDFFAGWRYGNLHRGEPEILDVNGSKLALVNNNDLFPPIYKTPHGIYGTPKGVLKLKKNYQFCVVGDELYKFHGSDIKDGIAFIKDGEVLTDVWGLPEGSEHVKNWKAALDILLKAGK